MEKGNKPATGRRKRRAVAEKTPVSETRLSETSDDDGFSSTNTSKSRRSRSKSIEINNIKKGPRGRPRKNPVAPSPSAVSTVMSPPPPAKTVSPDKKPIKKQAARGRNSRQNPIKSKETVSTDSSSSDEETPPPPPAKTKSNSTPNTARLPIVSPRQQSIAASQNQLTSPSTNRSPALRSIGGAASNPRTNSISPATGRKSTRSKLSSSSDDDDDDANENGSSSNKSDDDDDDEDNSSDSGSSSSNDRDNKKVKSDKNKNDTLRKLFSLGKGEGGAKGKGQVVIVDHSEEAQQQNHHQQQQQQQHAQSKENSIPNDKLLSPYSYIKHTPTNYNNNNNNVLLNGNTDVSPLKLSNANTTSKNSTHLSQPIVCKIDLSRLENVPRPSNGRSPINGSDLTSRRNGNAHRRDNDRSPIDCGQNGGRRSRSGNIDDEAINARLNNSRDSSGSSTTTPSSKVRDNDTNSRRYDDERSKHGNYQSAESRLTSAGERNTNYKDEKPMNKIKRESFKNEINSGEYMMTFSSTTSPRPNAEYNSKVNLNSDNVNNIKPENIKTESTYVDRNAIDDVDKNSNDDVMTNNRKKRSSSANSSPYKDKKRKKLDDTNDQQALLPPTNHDRLDANLLPPPQKPIVTKVYVSYFERSNEDRDEIR